MKKNEMQYPELGRYPLYWTAIAERRNVVVNDYLDAELLQEKANEIRNSPVIMVTQKVIQALQYDKAGLSHGETFEQNIKDLVSAYEPDAIFKLCRHTKTGRQEIKFESTTYGGDRNIQTLEICMLGEWQDDAFGDEPDCSKPEEVHGQAHIARDKQSYNIDHGC
jgi:hypothetical protein